MATILSESIINSGGLPSDWSLDQQTLFSKAMARGRIIIEPFNWKLLPTISFEILSAEEISPGVNKTFTLVLGPKQYIMQYDSKFWQLAVVGTTQNYATLGVPVFSSYYILMDKDSGSIGFSMGCGSNVADDGYPKILTSDSKTYSANSTGPGWYPTPSAVPSASFKSIKIGKIISMMLELILIAVVLLTTFG